MLGLPYAFASHFAPQQLMQAISIYRETFKPSAQLQKPYVMLGFNVFVADTDPVLVLTSGGNRVDVVKVGRRRDAATVRKADAEEVRAATGYAIGGTPPFGHARELAVLIDRHLTGFEVVWAAAGTPRHVFPIAPADLVRASGGQVADVTLGEEGPPAG